jgi:uncharacterized protein DUF4345
MSAPRQAARSGAVSERTVRVLFGALAAGQVALGLLMVVAPKVFFDDIGPFGARNDHYIRDVSTFYLAFGAGLAVAVRRPSWRVPVIAVVAVQYVLHVVNHLVDISKADPGWLGPADAISLAATAALLLWLWREEAR